MKQIFNIFFNFLTLLNYKKKYHSDGVMVSYTHDVKKENVSNFEKLIIQLKTTHNIISPSDFFNYYEKGTILPERAVLMTFDDGFLSSYSITKSVLNKYNIKAIFFIPTRIFELKSNIEMRDFTNKNIYFDKSHKVYEDEYLFMNKSELLDLINDGHYIAPHTHNHTIVKNLINNDDVFEELITPKKIINELFLQNRSVFAFPVGTEKQVSKYIYDHIQNQYDYCFTTLVGVNNYMTNKYCLHRFNLPPNSSIKYLKSVLQGSFNYYYGLKMKRLKLRCNVK